MGEGIQRSQGGDHTTGHMRTTKDSASSSDEDIDRSRSRMRRSRSRSTEREEGGRKRRRRSPRAQNSRGRAVGLIIEGGTGQGSPVQKKRKVKKSGETL